MINASNGDRPIRLTDLWFKEETNRIIKVFSDSSLALDEYQLDEVGSVVWELCDGSRSVEDISEEIASRCQNKIPVISEIYDDILTFLNQLKSIGLVDWQEDNAIDVLLVAPPFPTLYSPDSIKTPEYSVPPLGICYLAAVLRERGYAVAIYDMHQGACLTEDIVAECRKLKPKIVGITSTTPTFPNSVQVAKFIKAYDDSIVTVVGGAHPTGLPEECINSGAFDYVCIGEGEQSLLELTEALLSGNAKPAEVSGFAFATNDGETIYSRPRDRLPNLDDLPFPARDLIDLNSYYQKGSIVSARGCPFNCNYCTCAAIAGKTYRCHSIAYVLDEIEHIKNKYGCNFFDFHDDIFNLYEKRVFEFCQLKKERGLSFDWGCFCRAAQFSPKMAEVMANADCKVVQFGVESGSALILNSIKKGTTLEQMIAAVKAASDAGIAQIACGFIIGHPEETEKSINETIEFGLSLAQMGATRLTLSLLTPYPGTEVYEKRDELGIKLLTTNWENYIFSRVVIETKHLTKDRLREQYAKGISKFLEATKS